MTQTKTIKFLRDNGIDFKNMSFAELNWLIAIANEVAEECFKEYILKLCKKER